MMKHRINTDLFLRIAVTRIGGEPEEFSTANDITVTVWHMYHNWRRQEEYQINGNEVSLQLSAGDQSHIGPYGVTIRYTKPDSGSETGIRHYAVDIPKAFELSPIACCEVGDTVTLCAHVMVCRDGIDGSTPYIGENGNWWVGGEDTGKPSQGKAYKAYVPRRYAKDIDLTTLSTYEEDGEVKDFVSGNMIYVENELEPTGYSVYIYMPHGTGYAWVKIVLITDGMHLILVKQ